MKSAPHWKPIGQRPHHGILLPLFALRSEKSSGIGEFLDLLPVIDFCAEIGFDTIQLLPLNDTGNDPSPYNPLSSCALNPIYIRLESNEGFEELNQSPRVRTQEVREKKLKALAITFTRSFSKIRHENAYQQFLQYQGNWLISYAQNQENPEFHLFLQYLCFQQMEKVKRYAEKKKIFLKGDIPILLSPQSIDVKENYEFFLPHLVAGAPPDYYNPLGQKWGFPIFDWDGHKNELRTFWKQRLSSIASLYHLYRIDHVVGFFRIWAIPEEKMATDGYFIPIDRSRWETQGRELLSMLLDFSPLLPIAEDLGTIPDEVPRVLKELGICGTHVVRWQRRWNNGKELIPLSEYSPLSLTTLSTPDSETLQMWWTQYPEEAQMVASQKNWTYHPTLSSEERFSLLYDAHHTPSYFHINLLQEYFALFPELVSSHPDEERINVPGTIAPTNWTYRFRTPIETWSHHIPLIKAMRQLRA